MTDRMLEHERRTAHPRDYMNGLGGTTQPVEHGDN
jgi:hypothetical protein